VNIVGEAGTLLVLTAPVPVCFTDPALGASLVQRVTHATLRSVFETHGGDQPVLRCLYQACEPLTLSNVVSGRIGKEWAAEAALELAPKLRAAGLVPVSSSDPSNPRVADSWMPP
jgi:hypothetical protein